MAAETIRFYHQGVVREISGLPPHRTVLQYLREDRHCTGTKEGCAEGDCGACVVVIGTLQEQADTPRLVLRAVNSCIQLLPTLDGKALFTVEDLRSPDGRLHPVQQAMVDCHASQCGFCTPGFVMSLWALYQQCANQPGMSSQPQPPDRQTIDAALSGNLCRCTGYRPIIEAARQMHTYPAALLDTRTILSHLQALQRRTPLHYRYAQQAFHAPQTLQQLAALRAQLPQARLLAGSTDMGLWITKQFRSLDTLIYLGQIPALQALQIQDGYLEIGAAVTLEAAYAAICQHYPELRPLWRRFASLPVRQAGTLGGNLANGSPIGDSMPWLIALGAQVVLSRQSRADGEQVAMPESNPALVQRILPLEALYLAYQQTAIAADEFLQTVRIPLPNPARRFRCYKLSKRHDQDISAVCAAFALRLDGEQICDARIVFGGMAGTPCRAPAAEAALLQQPWCEATVLAGMAALATDYQPLSDMRASQHYRLQAAQNLLYRFWLETRPNAPLRTDELDVFACSEEPSP